MREFLSAWVNQKSLYCGLAASVTSIAAYWFMISQTQSPQYEPGSWIYAITFVVFLFGAILGFFLSFASLFAAGSDLDRQRYSLTMLIGFNAVSVTHNGAKDIHVGASFSEGTELVADPDRFVKAVNQAITSALPDICSYRTKVHLNMQLMDDVKTTYGQTELIGYLSKRFLALQITYGDPES